MTITAEPPESSGEAQAEVTIADLAAAFWEAYLADPDSDRTWELFNALDRRADWRTVLSLGDLVESLENGPRPELVGSLAASAVVRAIGAARIEDADVTTARRLQEAA